MRDKMEARIWLVHQSRWKTGVCLEWAHGGDWNGTRCYVVQSWIYFFCYIVLPLFLNVRQFGMQFKLNCKNVLYLATKGVPFFKVIPQNIIIQLHCLHERESNEELTIWTSVLRVANYWRSPKETLTCSLLTNMYVILNQLFGILK